MAHFPLFLLSSKHTAHKALTGIRYIMPVNNTLSLRKCFVHVFIFPESILPSKLVVAKSFQHFYSFKTMYCHLCACGGKDPETIPLQGLPALYPELLYHQYPQDASSIKSNAAFISLSDINVLTLNKPLHPLYGHSLWPLQAYPCQNWMHIVLH